MKHPRRSDINRARRAGFAAAARHMFMPPKPPYSHPAMRLAFIHGRIAYYRKWNADLAAALRRMFEPMTAAVRRANDAFVALAKELVRG